MATEKASKKNIKKAQKTGERILKWHKKLIGNIYFNIALLAVIPRSI